MVTSRYVHNISCWQISSLIIVGYDIAISTYGWLLEVQKNLEAIEISELANTYGQVEISFIP